MIFARALSIVPLCGTVVAFFFLKEKSLRLILALLILPPLFAEAMMILVASPNLTGRLFVQIVLAYLPFAIFGLGLWSPFIGLLAAYLTESIARRNAPITRRVLTISGPICGAAVAATFLTLYVAIANAINSNDDQSPFLLWILGGTAGGAIGGLIVALSYRTRFPAKGKSTLNKEPHLP
jgi:hypothetical protein